MSEDAAKPTANRSSRTSSRRTSGPLKVIGGFEILSKLGQGAMGAVFKARQVSLDREVALKVLPPKIARDRKFIERFQREARASAKLNHPHIVQGIEFGRDDPSGLWYFAMEFVDGPTLKQVLQKEQALDETRALEIVRDVAMALECAEKNGIVHRDIKPDNILLTARGEPKLADLGLAKKTSAEEEDASLTQAGKAIGTPHYMAPEQVRGEAGRIDIRTDLYALGATLFHLVTGQTPFSGQTAAVIMSKHLTEQVPLAHKVSRKVSEATGRLIKRMMQKEPEKRVRSPREVVEQIEKILGRGKTTGPRKPIRGFATGRQSPVRGTTGPRAPVGAVTTGRQMPIRVRTTGPRKAVGGRGESPGERTRPEEKSKLPLIAGGVVGAALLLGLVLVGLGGGETPRASRGKKSARKLPGKLQPNPTDNRSLATPLKAPAVVAAPSTGPATPTNTAPPASVQPVSTPKEAGRRITRGLVALYDFEAGRGNVVKDVSGVEAALDLKADPKACAWIPGGLSVRKSTLLASAGPARKIIAACRKSNEITLEAWIKPDNTRQGGPARIVTLSRDKGWRNFTFGQRRERYDVRLRSTATDTNGHPSLTSSPSAVAARLSHVVYTRDASGKACLYVDGVLNASKQVSGTLSNWDETLRLALANEMQGNRTWLGEFYLAAIYSRALSPGEVRRNFEAGKDAPQSAAPVAVAGKTSPAAIEAPTAKRPAPRVKSQEPGAKSQEPSAENPASLPAARAAYADFAGAFLALLRKGDRAGAQKRLAQAEKDERLQPLAAELARSRAALAWWEDLERAVRKGAEKLKGIQAFELRLTRGSPIKIGQHREFQVSEVKDGSIYVGSKGMSMPIKIERLHAETRRKLAGMGLGVGGPGQVRRAFAQLLAMDGTPGAAAAGQVKAAIEQAEKAGARAAEVAYLRGLLEISAKGAAEVAAQAAWEALAEQAKAKHWEALQEALVSFTQAHGGTKFAQARKAEILKWTAQAEDMIALANGHFYDFNTPESFAAFQRDFSENPAGVRRNGGFRVKSRAERRDGKLRLAFRVEKQVRGAPVSWYVYPFDWAAKKLTWKGDWEFRVKLRHVKPARETKLDVKLVLVFKWDRRAASGFCFREGNSMGRLLGDLNHNQRYGFTNDVGIWRISKGEAARNIHPGRAYSLRWVKRGEQMTFYLDGKEMAGGAIPPDLLGEMAQAPVRLGVLAADRPDVYVELDDLYFGPIRKSGAAPSVQTELADSGPWRAILDGKSLNGLTARGGGAWKLEGGGVVNVAGKGSAAQTAFAFSDGEVRIRFRIEQPGSPLFAVRQGADGTCEVALGREEARRLLGKTATLTFRCQGETVRATLDGQARRVAIRKFRGRTPLKGQIQFNMLGRGGKLRVLSIEYRPVQTPPASNLGSAGKLVQKLFKGKVERFDPATRAIALYYDFERPEQLEDWEWLFEKYTQSEIKYVGRKGELPNGAIRNGKLVKKGKGELFANTRAAFVGDMEFSFEVDGLLGSWGGGWLPYHARLSDKRWNVVKFGENVDKKTRQHSLLLFHAQPTASRRAPYPGTRGKSARYTLRVKGDRLTFLLNGRPVIQDWRPARKGKPVYPLKRAEQRALIGFDPWAGPGGAAVDNVRIQGVLQQAWLEQELRKYRQRIPAGKEGAGKTGFGKTPGKASGAVTDAFIRAVAKLPPEQQFQRVIEKFKELNPAMRDRRPWKRIDKKTGKITEARIRTHGVHDVSPLRALPELKKLWIVGGRGAAFTDLNQLHGLHLEFLDAQNNPIEDLAPLQGMPLASLNLSRTKIKDLAPLKSLPLRDLIIGQTPVTDLSALKGMTLNRLDAWRTAISDLSALKGMPLTSLSLYQTKVTDLTPLKGMPLASLHLYQTRITSLGPLENATKLRYLNVGTTAISDLGPLRKLRALRELRMDHTKVASLAPLKGLKLNALYAQNTPLKDLAPLLGMPLKVLYLSNTPVSGLAPLKGMPLSRLDLSNAPVSDLSPLQGMPLTWLNLTNTRAGKLAPLRGMPLRDLYIQKTQVQNIQPLQGMPLRGINLDYRPPYAKVLRSLKELRRINRKKPRDFWREQGVQPGKQGRGKKNRKKRK